MIEQFVWAFLIVIEWPAAAVIIIVVVAAAAFDFPLGGCVPGQRELWKGTWN